MIVRNPLTVIDIGTTKVICMLVQPDDSALGFSVLSYSFCDCDGLARGAVVDIDETVRVIRQAVQEVESQSGQKIRDVVVGISGHHVSTMPSNGIVGIRNREVTQVDVERVIEAAKAIALPDNQTVLHVLPQEFIVDDQAGVIKPIGMSGVRLESRVQMVMAGSSALQNIIKCVEFCGLRVSTVTAQQLATCSSVLSNDEQDLGVCLLDIGGGTTDIAVCQRRSLKYASAIPIAGDHVTNDIAVALCTPPKSAENIKLEYGKIVSKEYDGVKSIQVESLSNRSTQKVSKKLLAEVIEARYMEIFTYVKRDLRAKNYLSGIPGGIVLTGGASKIPGLVSYASKVFDCQVRLAEPLVPVQDGQLEDARYAASVGLVLQALIERDRLSDGRTGAISRMFKRFQYWLDYHL